jgi:hypothetical protein
MKKDPVQRERGLGYELRFANFPFVRIRTNPTAASWPQPDIGLFLNMKNPM